MITIEKLKLHNFMSCENADLTFPSKGITMLVGENGYGKSAVADAITLCFLESKRSDTYKDYVKQGTDEAEVHLEGTLHDEPIVFDISISGSDGKLKKRLQYKGETFATSSEVTKKLDELDISYFADILFTTQKADSITELTPLKRAEYMKRLLSVSFDEELAKIQADTDTEKEFTTKKNLEREQKQQLLDGKDSEIQDLLPMPDPAAIQTLSTELTVLSNDINMLTEQVTANSETTTAITKKKDEISAVDTKIAALNTEVVQLNNAVGVAKTASETIQKSREGADGIQKDIENTQAALAEATKKRDEGLVKVNGQTTACDTAMQAKNTALASKTEKQKVYSEAVNAESTGVCPTCHRAYENFNLDEAKASTAKAKAELDTASIAYSAADSAYTEALNQKNIALKEQTVLENSVTSLSTGLSHYQMELSRLPSEASIKAQVVAKDAEIAACYTSIEAKQIEIQSQQTSKNSLLAEVEELNKKIVTVDSNLLRQKSIERMTKQSSLDELNKVSATNAQIAIQNQRVKDSKAALEVEIASIDKDIADSSNKIALYKEARQILEKDLPNFLIVRTCAKLEETINQQVQASFPDLEIYLFQSKKGVEFFFTTDKEKSDPEDKDTLVNAKMLSGCQKDFVTVAFKLALARAYKVPFAFFDEIDSAATDDNSERLYSSILTSGILSQVFIVTHRPETRNIIANLGMDVTCYRLPEKGVFQLTEDLGDVN